LIKQVLVFAQILLKSIVLLRACVFLNQLGLLNIIPHVVIHIMFKHLLKDNQIADHVFRDVYGVLQILSILVINATLELIEMKDKVFVHHVLLDVTLVLLITLVLLVILDTI